MEPVKLDADAEILRDSNAADTLVAAFGWPI